jgi:hypothetical protein
MLCIPTLKNLASNASSIIVFDCPAILSLSLWRKQRQIFRFFMGLESIVVDVTHPLWIVSVGGSTIFGMWFYLR